MVNRGDSGSSSDGRRCAIVIASAGRAATLERMLQHLEQVRPPLSTVIVSVPDRRSLPDEIPDGVIVVSGTRGAAAQRNRGVDAVPAAAELVFFFDDDTLIDEGYCSAMVATFDAYPEYVGLTGQVVRDGAMEGALTQEEGLAALSGLTARHHGFVDVAPVHSLYGCNFAVRSESLTKERFDERLPLYSWLEDEDLSQRLRRSGRIGVARAARCVHLAVPSGGRADHLRFGYSQVANAVHLRRKGSVSWRRTFWLLRRPIASNLLGSVVGRSTDWRRRRLLGNLRAARDVLAGDVAPERILRLPKG